jgi:ATP-binding cassette subfamily B protein
VKKARERDSPNDIAVLYRLLAGIRPYWGHLLGVFGVGLLGLPLPLLTPVPLKIAVDSVIGLRPLPQVIDTLLPGAIPRTPVAILAVAASMMVIVALLEKLQQLTGWVYQTYVGERLVLDFRGRLFHHAQRLSLTYHETKGTADSLYRIVHDAPSVQYITVFGLIPLAISSLILAGMVIVTARIDPRLALVATAVAPVLFGLTIWSRKDLLSRWDRAKAVESDAVSVLQEVLSSIRVVKAFGKEPHEENRYLGHATQGAAEQVALAFASARFYLLVGITIGAGMAVVLFLGVTEVRAGTMTLGSLLVVMAYLSQIYTPLETATKNVAGLQSGLAGARRAFALLDAVPDVPERRHARPLPRARGNIVFQHVSFEYRPGHPVLDDINLKIRAGSSVGIAGPTGAGKTTLVNLLTRFYDPSEGRILLDGVDLRDYRLADLRSQFAVMLQDPVLFSTTIAENIAYARPGAREHQIVAAARAANAHEFISQLPDGYDTRVGERGTLLSGGERQRVSLARAFLKDAPILILDEPTSAVDVRTETGIVEATHRLMRGRTTFMIAHRLSTLERCNVRLHIEHGRLAEALDRPLVEPAGEDVR